MSFSLHSSTENLGGGRRSWSVGSNSSTSLSEPEKSSMGLMSRKASDRPLSRNHWKESRCTEMRSGSGKTSSRLAKEKRSRVTGRDDKDYSSRSAVADRARAPGPAQVRLARRPVEPGCGSLSKRQRAEGARLANAPATKDAEGQGTATDHYSPQTGHATRRATPVPAPCPSAYAKRVRRAERLVKGQLAAGRGAQLPPLGQLPPWRASSWATSARPRHPPPRAGPWPCWRPPCSPFRGRSWGHRPPGPWPPSGRGW